MKRARIGVVMIEFTMAAVGLVAIALVTVRVGHWLNDAMVERNASFQASRDNAGRGPGVEPFGGPSQPLKLLGPHAALTPGQGTPGGGSSTIPPTCGSDLLSQATGKRMEAASLLIRGAAFTLDEQSQITYINAIDWNMLVEANYLANHAIRVDDILNDLVNRIYPRLLEIQEMDIVQGSGVYDFCNRSNVPTLPADVVGGISVPAHDLCPLQGPTGIHQIDERLNAVANELNSAVEGTVGWEWNLLNTRKWEIIRELYSLVPAGTDGDPDGTLAWRRAAVFAAYLQAAAACNVAGQSVVAREMPISSCMGPDHPLGIDIDGVTGDTLHAFKGGRVIDIATGVPNCHADRSLCPGFNGGYGNYVVIDHGDGTMTWYSHLDTVGVAVGQEVLSGEEIGTMGNTGYSDGDHLHFEQHVRVDGVWTRVDPLGGQSCTEYVTTSDALGSGPAGTCDEALKNDLLHQLDHPVGEAGPGDLGGLNQQWDALYADGQAINARLDALQPVYNYLVGQLWGLWGPYMESSSGWGLYPQAFSYLDQVDSIVNAWNPLWQQLHNERPADFPSENLWDIDLSDLFRDTVQAWDDADANSPDTVVVEEIPGYLDVIIGRLLLLMRERLDHTDWSELPWFMGSDDYTGIIPAELVNRFSRFGVPLTSDDDHNPGGQREANARVMALADHPFIEHTLIEYNDEIREKILQAEEWERQARRDCTSEPGS